MYLLAAVTALAGTLVVYLGIPDNRGAASD
jgi:hypothetical protein